MPGRQPHLQTRTALTRCVLGLAALTLLIGCDGGASGVNITPTPVVVATPTALPTPSETSALGLGNQPTATSAPEASATSSPTQLETAPTAQPLQPITTWAPMIPWRGGNWFLLGVNYPYFHYGNDFGGNAWGSYGVHDPKTYAEVDADFARMASLGVRTARWFVFADGRAGITYAAAGLPTGLDQWVFPDLDAALEIARKHDVALNLVLLDFRFLWDAHMENGVQLGGHANVLATPEGQQALLSKVIEPVLQRYARHPAILSWEVMNEPEWGLQDAGDVDRTKISRPLTMATFRPFAQRTVDAIHSIAGAYATMGTADAKWAQNWAGLGLDYYQIHYYDWMKPYSTDNLFGMTAQSFNFDRPVIVGEFPADHSTVAGLRDYLDTWYKNGYAGAWVWSFRADTTWGGPDHTVLSTWASDHQQVVDIPKVP